MAGPSQGKARSRRSGGPVYDPDMDFPPYPKFQPVEKLPTIKSVICMVRDILGGGIKGITEKMAIREVAKQVHCKWYVDTVYCLSLSSINRKLTEVYKTFSEGKKRMQEVGKETSAGVIKYKQLVGERDKLFDVFQKDPVARLNLQKEWSVKMSDMEFIYYEDQKKERKMFCSRGVPCFGGCQVEGPKAQREAG